MTKHKPERRDIIVRVRVGKEERARWHQAAQRYGLRISDLMRDGMEFQSIRSGRAAVEQALEAAWDKSPS